MDEVWVGSRFAADSIERATEKPVTVVPVPASPPGATMSREMLGLPQGFMFLFVFDYFSVFERKNPLAIVEAFVRGFSPDEPVSLVIKSINRDKNPRDLGRLRSATERPPNIRLIQRYLDPAQKAELSYAATPTSPSTARRASG